MKSFEKQTKTTEEQGRKQIDAATNQKERLSTKEIFENLVKEKFDEIQELTDEINQND